MDGRLLKSSGSDKVFHPVGLKGIFFYPTLAKPEWGTQVCVEPSKAYHAPGLPVPPLAQFRAEERAIAPFRRKTRKDGATDFYGEGGVGRDDANRLGPATLVSLSWSSIRSSTS